ncbi:MAG: TolC family protein [Gemmatimonadaceae bacterium]
MNLQICFRTCAFVLATACAQNAGAQRPLTLRALLDSVRTTHPAMRAADNRVRAAEGSRATARTFGNPVLGYQVDQTPLPGGRPLPGDMEREAMTTATLPLEFLYQRGPRVARANADVRAAEADATGARQRLALDASAAFYRAGLAQARSATTHDLLGWLDTLVIYNRSRVEEGAAAEVDLIRSELERDRVAAEASMQDADLAQARAALSAFVSDGGRPAPMPVVIMADAPLPLPPILPDLPSQTAIDARSDVRAARERVTSANAGVSSERSMLVRQLGATIGTMQTGRTTSMIAGLSVPLPLLDQNRGEVERARAEREVATFELATQVRVAAADIRGAYEAARILTDRAAILARRDSTSFLARADESRCIALGAYREGAVPLFQVIDAARSWADARNTYFATIAAQHESILILLAATGTDLFTAIPAQTSNEGGLR